MSANLLHRETSPYLLQHKDNPVHWRPWGTDAFADARASNKPVFLSIGYSACHWCHVMAHESFENPDIAAIINALFVSIKVDREERPDIDQIYMSGLQALGGRGGWPLSVFLTPDGKLFWGGTYFPPTPRFGRAGFGDVLRQVAKAFHDQPEKVAQNALRAAKTAPSGAAPDHPITFDTMDAAVQAVLQQLDPVHGGLSGAPKFPNFTLLEFLWRAGDRLDDPRCREAVVLALRNMCLGGIFDHVGGGLSRYSTDERWHVPHFEKMLYDNALFVRSLALAWSARRDPLFKQAAELTVDWLVREMRMDEGAFASSLDADSEGAEGKVYTWTFSELEAALGADDAAFAAKAFHATDGGNWEDGRNVLHRLGPASLDGDEMRLGALRRKLLAARSQRIAPARDDKVLADWNGLVIDALCAAGLAFERADWLVLAREAYAFVTEHMVQDDRVGHSARLGRVSYPGFSTDAANIVAAALALHQASGDAAYLKDALRLNAALHARYFDPARGYCLSAADTSDLQERPHGGRDDATPNANATAAHNLVRLGALTGDPSLFDQADRVLNLFGAAAEREPFAYLGLFNAFDFAARLTEVTIVGPQQEGAALAREALGGETINIVLSRVSAEQTQDRDSPAFGRTPHDGLPTAYVCRAGVCSLPATTPAALRALLRDENR